MAATARSSSAGCGTGRPTCQTRVSNSSTAFNASQEVYAELSAENAAFKKMYEAMLAYRDDWYLYQQTAEYTFDTFMMIQQRSGGLATEG